MKIRYLSLRRGTIPELRLDSRLERTLSKVAAAQATHLFSDAVHYNLLSLGEGSFEELAGRFYAKSDRRLKARFLNLLLFSGLDRQQIEDLLRGAGVTDFRQLVNSAGTGVTWNQARRIDSLVVGRLAAHAQAATGKIIPGLSRLYAEHPRVIVRTDKSFTSAVLRSIGQVQEHPVSGRVLVGGGPRISEVLGSTLGVVTILKELRTPALPPATTMEVVETTFEGLQPPDVPPPVSSAKSDAGDQIGEARFVNFDFRELESGGRSLLVHEGFRTKYTYELAISIQPTADRRFGGSQSELKRPEAEEVVLDAVIFTRNLTVVGEACSTLSWPPVGPSTEATFKVTSPEMPGDSLIDVLLYHNHDVLFVATLHIKVQHEADEWDPDGRPIDWKDIGPDQKDKLQVFKGIGTLNSAFPRAASIAVVSSSQGRAYDMILYRKSAAYPIRVFVTREELDVYAGKVRAVLDQVWRARGFIDGGFDEQGRYTGEFLGEKGGFRSSKKRSVEAPAAFRDFLRTIATIGKQLWDKLFESEAAAALGREVEGIEAGSTIQIWTHRDVGDFILPWLWLYPHEIQATGNDVPDRQSFWGYRFQIEQIRQYPETIGVSLGDPVFRIPKAKIVASVHNFQTAQVQKDFLEDWAKRHKPALEICSLSGSAWRDYLALCDCQLIYLYCHGHTAVPRPGALDQLAATERLLAQPVTDESEVVTAFRKGLLESIQQIRKDQIVDETHIRIGTDVLTLQQLRKFKVGGDSGGPMVFLNMCESAQIWPSLTDGLVDVFLRRGARGVLGTEMPIPSRFGDLFGREFFEEFSGYHDVSKPIINGEGRSVGEVLWVLRRRFLDAGNPLVFAYSYYGDTTVRFRPALAGIISPS